MSKSQPNPPVAVVNAVKVLNETRKAFFGATSVYLNVREALDAEDTPVTFRQALNDALVEAEYDVEIRALEYRVAVSGEREAIASEVE